MTDRNLWPLIVTRTLSRRTQEAPADWKDHGLSLNLHPELCTRLDDVLEPYGRDSSGWECSLQNTFRQAQLPIPWAIVMYEKEYPLAGHFLSIRGDEGQLPFTSWSVGKHWGRPELPPFSVILALSKDAFERAAERSPMLDGAWEALRDCHSEGHWACIAPALEEETISRLSTRDSTCPTPIQ